MASQFPPIPPASFYRDLILGDFLPFWSRAVDREHGGVFTCFSNDGARLVSRDKYTWSQGRFLWLWSRLAEHVQRGLLAGDFEALRGEAALTARFLQEHAFLENGNCAFLLGPSGEKKLPPIGEGYDASIFADCFVAMGFGEYARVFGEGEALDRALGIYDGVLRRVGEGGFRTAPEPVPSGYRSHAVPMILLNLALVLDEACVQLGHSRAGSLDPAGGAEQLLDTFSFPGGRLAEMLPAEGPRLDNLLSRHMNPGHAIESMWFVMTAARRAGREDLVGRAAEVTAHAFDAGWDEEFGGLLHYIDFEGGAPKGERTGAAYESSIERGWSDKLWWVHSEALYTTLLARQLTGDASFGARYRRVHDYTFHVFPNPDRAIGEWIQIRDREGRPVEKVVALPVKDPYHILRNFLLIVELLEGA